MLIVSIYLAVLGLCAGSFVNALVWRIHESKDFVRGRSQCTSCGHQLATKDLVPIFSWLSLKGRCRYCRQSISVQYPLVEAIAGLTFVASYLLWPSSLQQTGNLVQLITWLIASVGLLALAVYDLKWMLLPSKILYPTFVVAVLGQVVYLVGYAPDKTSFLINWAASIVVASGLFWLLFTVSRGHWIGYGDVRLGLITGTLLAKPSLSFLMIFIASLLGSLVILPLLVTGKKGLSAKIPYGPFLVLATAICLLFGQSLIDWYKNLFIT